MAADKLPETGFFFYNNDCLEQGQRQCVLKYFQKSFEERQPCRKNESYED